MADAQSWRELGQQLRVDAIRCSAAAKSGHPTSSMSAADLAAVLVSKYLRYDFGRPAGREGGCCMGVFEHGGVYVKFHPDRVAAINRGALHGAGAL